MIEMADVSCPLNIERARFLDLLNFDKNISRAKGPYLYTDDGEIYLDFTSQYGAVPFGHNADFIWEEVLNQSMQSPGVMIQPFHSQGALALAHELLEIAPGKLSHVTLACSGAEAIETAIKMARSRTGRAKILSTINGFHGKTMAASLATGNPYYSEPFQCENVDFVHIPYNDLAALEEQLKGESYAAFLVEPIQGEGGMIVPAVGYLKGCEALCAAYGTLFVVDEIQVGLGRTGKLFACENEGVNPDILVIAKALGGGLIPISACIASAKAWSKNFGQRHSSTFANNHLGAQIGLAVIRRLRSNEGILENVRVVGEYLSQALTSLVVEFPNVFLSSSGVGFMQGIALVDWRDEDAYVTTAACEMGYAVPLVASFLLNKHKIYTAPTLNASNVLRIQPNYLTTKSHIDKLIVALRDVGKVVSEGRFEEIFRAAIGLKLVREKNASQTIREFKNTIAKPSGPKLGTFAFFIHPTQAIDTLESMPGGASAYNEKEKQKILHWMNKLKYVNSAATPAFYLPCIPSKQGGYVDGWLISSMLTPVEMMRLSKKEKSALLMSYMDAAKSVNATMVGLGAFTSVISRSGALVADYGIPITTGNAYTAMTSTDSIRQICKRHGRRLADQHLGIVGVSGSVGRLALFDLGPECKKISLIGNAKNKSNHDSLEAVAGELILELFSNKDCQKKAVYLALHAGGVTSAHIPAQEQDSSPAHYYRQVFYRVKYIFEFNTGSPERFPFILSNEISRQLPLCDIVLTATSNGEAFIKPEFLAENAIVCDVARPSDLTAEVLQNREDIFAYEGGLVKLPAPLRFGGANIVGLDTGISLACLSETVILTMSQAKKHYSIGGVSPISEAREVFQCGLDHGFNTFVPEFDTRFITEQHVKVHT